MSQIEVRRLGRVGDLKGSIIVTLPKGWVRFYGLGPGDEVEVITNGEVRIRPRKVGQGSAQGRKSRKPLPIALGEGS